MTDDRPYCECCGRGARPDADQHAEMVATLRKACMENDHLVFPGDRVSEQTAAWLLGKAPGTLANWAYQDSPLRYTKVRGRRTYALDDIASLMLAG